MYSQFWVKPALLFAIHLHIAAAGGHKSIVELLLANDADINNHDTKNRNALQIEVAGGHNSMVQLLRRISGANFSSAATTVAVDICLGCSLTEIVANQRVTPMYDEWDIIDYQLQGLHQKIPGKIDHL